VKNLKIRAKILLGFGIVLACILIMAVAVTVGNIMTSQNLSTIDEMVYFQEDAAYFQKEFGDADTFATILYYRDDEEAYNGGGGHFELAETYLVSMEKRAAGMKELEHFTSSLKAVREYLVAWSEAVDQLYESNGGMTMLATDAGALGTTLTEQAKEMYDAQIGNLVSDAQSGRDADALVRRSTRIDHAANVLNGSQVLVRFVSTFLETKDTSMASQILEMIDMLTASLEEYHENSSQAHDQDMATAAIGALEGYKTLINIAVEAVGGHNKVIEEAKQTVDETYALINAMMESVNDDVNAQIKSSSNLSMILMIVSVALAIFALLMGIIMAFAISGAISKPMVTLAAWFKKAGTTGDLSLQPENVKLIEELSKQKDELNMLSEGAAAFVQHVVNISDELNRVADGDLTTEVETLSGDDVMAKALQHMVDNLNNMFGNINVSTAQVSTGSKQIAEGAQSLAQGSTEQASSVEELSASISEIAQKTKDNAEMAGRAAILAGTIKDNAEKGSRQMDEMMSAVKDINSASQSISKVIKVIDDIAFQTNILALNAAVEAARAGQHGKGFAVVAEEVRSLASKSAEAAKDTGNLIADSMEKAALGSRIAGETSASLTEIVSGINESSQIVSQIAQSSDEQSAGIAQINSGINQVAQIVQQNSATAEESAAASEEMSGQATMLEDLVAQFKLKDSARRLPTGAAYTPKKQIKMPEKTAYAPDGGEYGKY
jgi:methyl-accepting chemotaxis protein